jgi:hypothetical protein
MTYRGIYRDGLVILDGDVNLHNGDHVEVNLRGGPSSPRAGRSRATKRPRSSKGAKSLSRLLSARLTKAQRIAAALAVRGDWAHRPEWRGKSSAQAAAELRQRAARRGRDA